MAQAKWDTPLDIDWPESNDDFWKDGEEGAYASRDSS
ncbi:hypothetical protein [Escherichia coli]